jgi:3-(3-hydroxy-phenyl)propionate hydroxylase
VDFDVAILGAGPTGLTLANLLGNMGIRTVLVERNASTVPAPRAVSIDDECLRTMQAAGVVDAVVKDIALDYGAHYFTAKGICFAKVEPKDREYGYPRRSAFSQVKLEATLRDELKRVSHVIALFGTNCASFSEDDEGVTLFLGEEGGPMREIRVRYLAACDGGRSATRRAIGAELKGSTYRERWLIVDLADTKERMRQTRVGCDPDLPFICLPGPNGTRRYEFMLQEGEDEKAAEDPGHVRELLAKSGPDADANVIRRQVYTFHARMVDKWNTKRVFLAGDAAHLTPPFAGQGMNSGVRDAHNLSWKLAAVLRGDLGPNLLETYEKERAPHAWSLIELAINIGRVMMPTSKLQAFFVQNFFRLARFIPPVHSYFAMMKYKPKPFYSEGFLLSDQGLNITGRMLPQPNFEDIHRKVCKFDEMLGSDFALVAYGDQAQATIAAARQENFGLANLRRIAIVPMRVNLDRDADPTIIAGRDVDDTMAKLNVEGRELLMLVRPDRYVAGAIDASQPHGVATFAQRVRDLVAQSYPTK